VTTFRTSRGTIVNVEAPEIVLPPGLVPEDLNRPWLSGGAGREALREELAPTRVIVDYGYGYKCWPYVGIRGEAVFSVSTTVFPPPNGKPIICKIFRLEGFAKPVEIGDLYSLDSRATVTTQPFVTLDGSILVSAVNDPDFTYSAIWRYKDGEWSKVYEDTGINMNAPAHFGQDPITRAIYGGYRNNNRSRVIKSVDDGETWSLVYDSAEASSKDALIYDVKAYYNNVIATKRDKRTIIRSSNGGDSWIESAAFPSLVRTINMSYDLGLQFITGTRYIYYSRDYFVTYKALYVRSGHGGLWDLRYPIRTGGRFLVSAIGGYKTIVFASKDLFHTLTPVYTVEGSLAPRIAAYGDYLLVGAELQGTLTRVTLPKTLERGISCPILLWENESVTDTVNGSVTDYIETGYNDKKTFYIISDQSGTLYIQARDEVAGDYKDIGSVSVSADTLTPYMTYYGARVMRLRFVPSAAATVSIWAILE